MRQSPESREQDGEGVMEVESQRKPGEVAWQHSLLTRALLVLAVGVGVLLGGILLQLSWVVDEFVDRLLSDRVDLASTTAHHLEQLLLHDIGAAVDVIGPTMIASGNADSAARIVTGELAYGAVFPGRIFVLDRRGEMPALAKNSLDDIVRHVDLREMARRCFDGGHATVQPVRTASQTFLVLLDAVVNEDWGHGHYDDGIGEAGAGPELVGYVGLSIPATGIPLTDILGRIHPGEAGALDLIGPSGLVVASTKQPPFHQADHHDVLVRAIEQRRHFHGRCHRCHAETGAREGVDILAFAPMPRLHLGMAVRQPEQDALAPAIAMRRRLLLWVGALAAVFVAIMIVFVRRVVGPVTTLARAVRGTSVDGTGESLPQFGNDELGILAASMEQWRRRLTQSIDTIVRQEKQLMRHEARRELLQRVLSAQEEERRRVARELHDTISQDLAAMRLRLERLARAAAGNGRRDDIASLERRTSDMIEGVRRLTLDLRPLILDKMGGFIPAVRHYLTRVEEEHGLNATLSTDGEERELTREQMVTLFRIFQESLSNIVQHSDAEHVIVTVAFDAEAVALTVEDDGRGFDASMAGEGAGGGHRGLGILGMEERANLLGGRMTIESGPDSGTTVHVVVPTMASGSEFVFAEEVL